MLRPDDRLRAAVRGDATGSTRPRSNVEVPRRCCVPRRFRPASARAHPSSRSPAPRASTSARIERFAHPVLLERARAAELATAAHPGARRRPVGADAAGDRDHRAGRPRPGPRRHQLGRLAQRGRPLDRADGVEGRPVRQPRALPVHPGRARRHGDRVRRCRQRADRPRLRAPAAAGRPMAQLDFDIEVVVAEPSRGQQPAPAPSPSRRPNPTPEPEPPAARQARAARKGKPRRCPAWEDVLLGVRSSGRAAERISGRATRRRWRPAPAAPASPDHPDAGAQHEPAPHRSPAPSPHRRRQATDSDEVEADGQQRMHPHQSQAEHHDGGGDDRGDERGHRQPGRPRASSRRSPGSNLSLRALARS